MAELNSSELAEVTFLTGIDGQGRVAHQTFWDWDGDTSYSAESFESKWGPATAGTGATVSVAFDPVSHWSTTEQQEFAAAMHLWSAVANITFNLQAAPADADIIITRGSDEAASGGPNTIMRGTENTTELGQMLSASISIDTSVIGFGPINGSFSTAGGYVWMTMLHEIGHVLGLGHAGAYDAGLGDSTPQYGGYDTRAWSIMSYIDVNDSAFPNSVAPAGGFHWGSTGNALAGVYDDVPTTLMPLDIVAAQRIYGTATDSPLAHGGQVFGFNTNIQGDIAVFYNFAVNTKPVVTIWDGGAHNTLDVSGFTQAAKLSLDAGTFSSAGGLVNNIAIAFGTLVETAIGGSGNDTIVANNNSDVLMGGIGSDSLIGGAANDHIYGNMSATTIGTADGNDYIDVGGGTNYANGNAGNDIIVGGNGYNRLSGGQGNDRITSGNGTNLINGNAGDDIVTVGNGNNTVHGGKGNDIIHVGSGTDIILGDIGDDRLYAGTGYNLLTGGSGSDLFEFGPGAPSTAHPYDDITDFDAGGTDHIGLSFGVAGSHVLHQAGASFASAALAASAAQSLFGAQAATANVAALQVGSDTYLFFNGSGGANVVDSAIHLLNVNAGAIDSGDFVLFS